MGLFKKMRDILFEEEEDFTNQIKITPEMRNEEPKEEKVPVNKIELPKEEKPVEPQKQVTSEREIYKKEPNFPFLDFDEDEFDRGRMPSKQEEKPKEKPPVRNPNAFEYERKKRIEKRTDFGRYERTEVTETVERRKFKPSPIISPVYGVLNKDYKSDEIQNKYDADKVDVQAVRDKAFGEVKKEVATPVTPRTTFYEETETVTITEPEEQKKKVKTIDELLEETSDIVVDVDNDLTDQIPALEDTTEFENPVIDKLEENDTEDTLENDLFDLIDSMYDSSEDGE